MSGVRCRQKHQGETHDGAKYGVGVLEFACCQQQSCSQRRSPSRRADGEDRVVEELVVAADMITVRCLIIIIACKASSVLMTWSLRVGPRSSEGPARAVDVMGYVFGQNTTVVDRDQRHRKYQHHVEDLTWTICLNMARSWRRRRRSGCPVSAAILLALLVVQVGARRSLLLHSST